MGSGAQAQNVLARIPIPDNSVGQITVDVALNLIYDAGSFFAGGNSLQIVDGETEAILTTVVLTYTPAGVGVNNALKHLYTSNPADGTIQVRNSASGELVSTFSLGANLSPQTMAVDSTRGRIYVNVYNPNASQWYVYAIEDLSNTRNCLALGSC